MAESAIGFFSFFLLSFVDAAAATIAPARESTEHWMLVMLKNPNLMVPAGAALLVIIAAGVVICVIKGKSNDNKGAFQSSSLLVDGLSFY